METTTSDTGATQLLFFDDFSGDQLDQKKWNVTITGTHHNNELQAYIDSDTTIYIEPNMVNSDQGGVLVLQPHYKPNFMTKDGQQFDFISGRINTRDKFDFTYGTAAARIKLPYGRGLWPAFWALGHNQWPNSGEIDILEYVGEPDWISSAIHGPGYFGEQGLVNNYYFESHTNATDWHIYSVEWSAELLTFKVDEATAYRIPRPLVEFHGGWAFDNPKYLILNFAIGGIYPFKINGIQHPYYGLPKDTLQAIQANQPRLLVDWVKVTQ